MKYSLEFTDADDSRLKDAYGEPLENLDPAFIPAVGDFVIHEGNYLRIIGRQLRYDRGNCYVQCFCRETNESDVRSRLKATLDD